MASVKGIVVTQGDPISLIIFNIIMDTVVRAVLEVVCGTQEARHGMEWAEGELNLVFYAHDRRTAGRNQFWVQDALTAKVEMFRRVFIETNL